MYIWRNSNGWNNILFFFFFLTVITRVTKDIVSDSKILHSEPFSYYLFTLRVIYVSSRSCMYKTDRKKKNVKQ